MNYSGEIMPPFWVQRKYSSVNMEDLLSRCGIFLQAGWSVFVKFGDWILPHNRRASEFDLELWWKCSFLHRTRICGSRRLSFFITRADFVNSSHSYTYSCLLHKTTPHKDLRMCVCVKIKTAKHRECCVTAWHPRKDKSMCDETIYSCWLRWVSSMWVRFAWYRLKSKYRWVHRIRTV